MEFNFLPEFFLQMSLNFPVHFNSVIQTNVWELKARLLSSNVLPRLFNLY